MKKSLLLLALVIVGAGVFWAATRPAAVDSSKVGAGGPAAQPKAPAPAAAGLAPDQDPARSADPSAATKPGPEAHASAESSAAPTTQAPRFSGQVSQEFLDTAEHMNRASLQEYRVKMRGGIAEHEAALRASTSARPSKSVTAAFDTDVWDVMRANMTTGALCFCVASGRDKERGVDLYDVYTYPADADPEWAVLQEQLEWIEQRLPGMP